MSGLFLILLGANTLTDGSASIAKRFNISNLVIGLTIVAFGTSAPEFVVTVISSIEGNAGIAIGNVVGSNLFNTLMIVGCTALAVPITVSKGTLSKEIPLCILSAIILFVCANDKWLDHAEENIISRTDGLLLLCFFLIFLSYTFAIAHRKETGRPEEIKSIKLGKSIIFVFIGLGALIGGGQLFVNGASGIARNLGVSDAIIGLTLVAGGTSLPELATSITAALKKNPAMAIGNAIGSNLFNLFFVLGTGAAIHPLELGNITNFDIYALILASVLLYITGLFFKKRTITRIEGSVLIACYILYISILIYQQ